jgi:putative tricarboxylic transport membrane protein
MDPNVALFTAGIGTLLFQLVTKRQVPVFLASSFAFIAPILAAKGEFGLPAVMGGVIAAGLVYILLSALVKLRGPSFIDRLLPPVVIAPVIIVICAIGAYTVHSSMFDVWLMLIFGVVGYLFKKLKYPLAPMVLALVLGDMAESSFRQAMLLSQGSLSIFWANPLVGSIAGLAMIMLLWPLWGVIRGWVKARERERRVW